MLPVSSRNLLGEFEIQNGNQLNSDYFYNEGNYGRTYKTVPTRYLVTKIRDDSELEHKPHYLKHHPYHLKILLDPNET